MTDFQVPEILLITFAAAIGFGLIALWVCMLVHCLKNEELSSQERLLWVLVIVLSKLFGGLIYYFMKYRPHRAARTT